MYSNIAGDANKLDELNKLKPTESRKKCCLFLDSYKSLMGSIADGEACEEVDY